MKNLILASVLGSAAAGFVVPALAGPVHFAITRPYSMYGVLPSNANLPSAATIGTAPLDFILTDVMIGSPYIEDFKVTVNGQPVLCCGSNGNNLSVSVRPPRARAMDFAADPAIVAGCEESI